MVEVAAAVEAHFRDALFLRALGDQLADRNAHRDLALPLDLGRDRLAARGCDQGDAPQVVDHLHVDVPVAPEHRQSRLVRAARYPLPHPIAANPTPLLAIVVPAHVVAPAALPAL